MNVRRNILAPTFIATLLVSFVAAISLFTIGKIDYALEAQPAFDALRHGHAGLFLDRSPAYGGSLILRAPLALLPSLWGGGALDVFRAVSAPAVLALLIYALLLWDAGARRGSKRAGWVALLLVAANPLAFFALRTGHAEEIIATLACIASAVAVSRGRPGLAGVLLGVAIACKPWAVIAVGPLMLLLDRGRIRFLAIAGAVTAAIVAPIMLHGGAGAAATTTVAHSTGTIANPWQVWWFFGEHAGPVYRTYGRVFHDYRVEPNWVTQISHPVVVLLPALICAVRFRAMRGRAWHDVLLLLAAVFFARCLLATWNHYSYALPAAFALGTWEVLAHRRAPVAAWALTLLHFAGIVVVPTFAGADVQAVLYLAWSLPFLAALMTAAFAPRAWAAFVARLSRRHARSAELAPGHVTAGLRADDPDEVLLAYR